MPEAAIVTEKLTRDFDGLRAVDDLNLEVPAGVIFGFLGPNGAGKTTTIRLLLGLLDPTRGTAWVLGHDVRREADQVRARVGVLLENDGLYSRLTAWDNLEFFGEIYRLPPDERRARAELLLRHLKLWDRRNDRTGNFSKGMRQKLALARALLAHPPLVFLDEPSVGLDPESAVALRQDILNLARQEGVTVFLTTHNLAEAEKVCGLVGVIRKGRLLAVDTPAGLSAQASGPRVEIRGAGFTPAVVTQLQSQPGVLKVEAAPDVLQVDLQEGAPVHPLVRSIVLAGAEVEEVCRSRASLEEAFLTLMQEDEAEEGA